MPREEAEKLIPKRAVGTRDKRVALSPEQLSLYERAVKRTIRDPALKALMLFLPRTGLRIAEACSLKKTNIKRRPSGRYFLDFKGKGDKRREVPAGRKVMAILSGVSRSGSPYVFPNTQGGRMAPARVQAACRSLWEAEPRIAGVTPHVLRHTYATQRLLHCEDVKRIQEHMGHGKIGSKKIPVVMLTYLHPKVLKNTRKAGPR
jgi:integrase